MQYVKICRVDTLRILIFLLPRAGTKNLRARDFTVPKGYRAFRAAPNEPPSVVLIFSSDQNKTPSDWMVFCFGGRGWIRTTEGIASRFTVCPLWPLGKSPILYSVSACLEPVDGLEPPTY